MVRRIVLILDDSVFDKLKQRKRKRTWEAMLIDPLLRERESKKEAKQLSKKETKTEPKLATKTADTR
jgi:hypothetical protein